MSALFVLGTGLIATLRDAATPSGHFISYRLLMVHVFNLLSDAGGVSPGTPEKAPTAASGRTADGVLLFSRGSRDTQIGVQSSPKTYAKKSPETALAPPGNPEHVTPPYGLQTTLGGPRNQPRGQSIVQAHSVWTISVIGEL